MNGDDIIPFCLYLMQKRGGDGGGRGKQQKCGGSCGRGGKQKFEQDANNWIVEQREEQWSNMHDSSAKNQCTRTRTFFYLQWKTKVVVNRTCIIMSRFSDNQSQANLALFLRQQKSTNEYFSQCLTQPIKKRDIALSKTCRVKPPKKIVHNLILMKFHRVSFMR